MIRALFGQAPPPQLLLIIGVIVISILIVQNHSTANWSANHINYKSPLIAMMACSMFLTKIEHNKHILLVQNTWRVISDTSFGIDIFHPFLMNFLCKALHLNPMCYGIFSVTLFFLKIIILSIITTLLFRKIPFIGRYI